MSLVASDGVSSVANLVGIGSGIFAILGFALCRSHLPTARLRRLDELIKETQDILNDAAEGDCLPDWVIIDDVRRRLVKYVVFACLSW